MVKGMISHLMPFLNNLPIKFRMLSHVVANHKERGMYAKLLQRLENKRSSFRYRPVVKREINGMLLPVHTPCCPGVKPTQPYRRLLDYHIVTVFITVCAVREPQKMKLRKYTKWSEAKHKDIILHSAFWLQAISQFKRPLQVFRHTAASYCVLVA